MKLWLNGVVLPADQARIDPADRGFTLGDGVFETIRIAAGQARHLARHWARLRAGAATLRIPFPHSDAALGAALAALLDADQLRDGAARVTLSRGPAPRGVAVPAHQHPTLLITVSGTAPPLSPVRVAVSQITRRNQHSPLSRIKSLNYLDSVLARDAAAAQGADDAMLLNTQGLVAEASAANLFVLRDGVLFTPPVADGALPGIMRGLILERCGAREASLPPSALPRSEAVFLSSSLGLRAVAALDGAPIPARPDLLHALWAQIR